MTTRDCHDFVTKIWAMNGGAEELEMIETHTVLRQDDLNFELERSGLKLSEWIPFNPIKEMLDYYSIDLVNGEAWDRQFMLIAEKA